jgi:peptidoglycan hydrolase-like protein with peptidoglycan-binding domain
MHVMVLGDAHILQTGVATSAFKQVVAAVVQRKPDAVVMIGDMTSGNPDDGASPTTVRAWWSGVQQALAPLKAAGIPILPIAGNHDYYTANHQQGYRDAWADLVASVAPLRLAGRPPYSYSCQLGDVHLCFVHVIDQDIAGEHAQFLQSDLAAASAPVKLVFGHIPAQSAMGQTSSSFLARMADLLRAGKADAYFCGHEHLYWDELVGARAGQPGVRQVIVGTPGAAYVFPLREDLVRRYCTGGSGTMPNGGVRFGINERTHEQTDGVVFVEIAIDQGKFEVIPWMLDGDGRAMNFDVVLQTRWLQAALGRALGIQLDTSGAIDAATTAAVRRFQTEQHLTVDGIAGPLTRGKLRQAIGE